MLNYNLGNANKKVYFSTKFYSCDKTFILVKYGKLCYLSFLLQVAHPLLRQWFKWFNLQPKFACWLTISTLSYLVHTSELWSYLSWLKTKCETNVLHWWKDIPSNLTERVSFIIFHSLEHSPIWIEVLAATESITFDLRLWGWISL